MALFSNYQFGGNPNHDQGLLALLQQMQPQAGLPQASPQQPAPGSWPESPSSNYMMGQTQVPLYGQQPEMSAAARAPAPQPAAPQPTQAAPMQAQQPGFGDKMRAGFEGFVENAHTGPLGAILGGISRATGGQNSTERALIAKGLDPEMAKVARNNPQIMAAVLPGLFGTKAETDDIKEYKFDQSQPGAPKESFRDFMARKRSVSGEFGLSGVWGTGPDGKPALAQLGKSGKAVMSAFPDGFQPARDPVKIEGPTETVLLDPQTRQVIQRLPKDIAGAQKQEAQGKVAATLNSSLVGADDTIKKIDGLLENPTGIASFAGPLDQYRPTWTMGSEGRKALTQFNQLKGKAFMEAYATLKGGGPITDIEGTKAGQALERMDRSLDEADFIEAVKDFRDAVKTGVEKLRLNAGGEPQQSSTSPAVSNLREKYGLK